MMKKSGFGWNIIPCLIIVGIILGFTNSVSAAEPIKLGIPSARAFAEGETTEKGLIMAIEEINAKGGVNVAGVKRKFRAPDLT